MEFCRVTLTFESADEILRCDHSNETSSAVLSHGTIYLVCSSNFWVCKWNPMMWSFKWNLSACTFKWCYHFFNILESEIWKSVRNLPEATFGSESNLKMKNKNWQLIFNFNFSLNIEKWQMKICVQFLLFRNWKMTNDKWKSMFNFYFFLNMEKWKKKTCVKF